MNINHNFDTNNQEMLGVNAICDFFVRNGWYFRVRPNPDIGIDADVEPKVDGKATNRHIALQIKSGPAYLKRKKNGNISFSIDKWHYDYWLASDRPVIIMLYDDDTKYIYWEQVRKYSIKKAKKNYIIDISPKNILTNESLDLLLGILDTYKPHNPIVFDSNLVSYEISISLIEEYSKSLKELTNDYEIFSQRIGQQILAPNRDSLRLHLNIFAQKIKKHLCDDYELLHKSCWYLAFFAFKCPQELEKTFLATLDNYIDILAIQKAIWNFNLENFKKFQHENFPYQVKLSGRNLERVVEDYISFIDLSINDYLTCKYILNHKDEQTDNAKP